MLNLVKAAEASKFDRLQAESDPGVEDGRWEVITSAWGAPPDQVYRDTLTGSSWASSSLTSRADAIGGSRATLPLIA